MPIYKMPGKKDGKQKYRVVFNYTDSSGKARQKARIVFGADEAKEAERLLCSTPVAPEAVKGLKIGELFEEFKKAKVHELRESSYAKTVGRLKLYVIPVFENTRISKLTKADLQKWKNTISEKELSIKTKRGIYTEFHSFLHFAVKIDYNQSNPLNSIGTFKDVYFSSTPETLHFYTPEQYKKYIAVAKKKAEQSENRKYFVFFSIAFYTGMRKGKINAMRWSDIENNVIHVRRSVCQKIKGKPLIETPPKNKSSYRTLQIPVPLMTILSEQKKRMKLNNGYTNEWRVCGGEQCIGDTSLYNENIEYATAAGLPVIRIHDFRHTHASLLVNAGINIQEIARRLGHADIKMTLNTYAHLYPTEEERALDVLNKIRA